jgi:hypothetical protein
MTFVLEKNSSTSLEEPNQGKKSNQNSASDITKPIPT